MKEEKEAEVGHQELYLTLGKSKRRCPDSHGYLPTPGHLSDRILSIIPVTHKAMNPGERPHGRVSSPPASPGSNKRPYYLAILVKGPPPSKHSTESLLQVKSMPYIKSSQITSPSPQQSQPPRCKIPVSKPQNKHAPG